MTKQAKAALLHLAISALLYVEIYQYRIIFFNFLYKIAELFFLILISPVGSIFLPFGLKYNSSTPHPVNVAIMGSVFALNSYFVIFLIGKINQIERLENVAVLIFLSAVVKLPFFALAYCWQQKNDFISIAITASFFAISFYFLIFLIKKFSQAIRRGRS